MCDTQERKSDYGAFERVRGLLQNAAEELPDCPLYLDLHSVSATLKATPPRHDTFRSALVNAGERCSHAQGFYTAQTCAWAFSTGG